MKIYLFPGLGFDHRIYEHLELGKDHVQFINWIEPLKREPIHQYAERISEQISNDDQNILIGHSFGGIISQEIASIKNVEKVFLISSIRSRSELPPKFKVLSPFGLHHLFLKQLSATTIPLWGGSNDYNSRAHQSLVKDMINQNSNHYLQWALKSLSEWQSHKLKRDTEVIQIHGNKDRTFPIHHLHRPDHVLVNAGHFMVYKRAQEISTLIQSSIHQ